MTFLLARSRFLVRDQLIRNDLQEVIFVGTFLSTILNFDRKSGGGGGGDRDGNKNLFEKCFLCVVSSCLVSPLQGQLLQI